MKKILLLTILPLFFSSFLSAQVTVTVRGIEGNADKRKRDPETQLTRTVDNSGVTLLASSHIPNPDFRDKWPIKYEFFVNGKLIETQVTSNELSRPIGLTITPNIAPLPFNYTVVATLLHPNSSYKTVINGAAFEEEGSSTSLTCTVDNAEGLTHTASDVQTVQTANNTIDLSFTAENSDSNISFVSSLTLSGDNLSGVAEITENDILTQEDVTGSISRAEDGTISNITIQGTFEFNCD